MNINRTGIILAGGKSSRFGSNKAIFDFQGKTMLKHSVDLLKPFCDKILISGDKEEYNIYNYPCVPDKYGKIGPLGGIISCLENSDTQDNIVVTCDMPLVSNDLLSKLILNHDKEKIVVFQDNSGYIYHFPLLIRKKHESKLKLIIEEGKYRLEDMLNEIGYRTVIVSEDEQGCMANINYPDDLLDIEKIYNHNVNK